MKLDIDSQGLMDFAAEVSDFSKRINTECSEISAATARLAQMMDAGDVAEIQRLTREITQILQNADPDLTELQERVEGYAKVIIRLQAIVNG